eukprot:m.283802 g.283802  ORF g.283802 m.283802 type:complete len:224 (-) comp22906_c6_seq1:129-800(-)
MARASVLLLLLCTTTHGAERVQTAACESAGIELDTQGRLVLADCWDTATLGHVLGQLERLQRMGEEFQQLHSVIESMNSTIQQQAAATESLNSTIQQLRQAATVPTLFTKSIGNYSLVVVNAQESRINGYYVKINAGRYNQVSPPPGTAVYIYRHGWDGHWHGWGFNVSPPGTGQPLRYWNPDCVDASCSSSPPPSELPLLGWQGYSAGAGESSQVPIFIPLE